MRKLNSKEQKEILLNILVKFNDYCISNNLKMYLGAGTLLGAIRHQGFIPWDDDVDVYMPRTDYDKLLKNAIKNSGNIENADYLKITEFTLNNSNYPFIKVVDTRTKINLSFNNNSDSSHMWIDVFPIDNVSPSPEVANNTFKKINLWRKVLMLNLADPKKGTTLTKRIIKPLIIPFAKLIGITKCNNAIINLSTSYNQEESDFVANNLWGLHSTREIMPKDAFMKENEVTFENHKFKTMSCWELHLKKLYGNYMQLPPKNQQESHNYDAYIN